VFVVDRGEPSFRFGVGHGLLLLRPGRYAVAR